MSRVYEAWRRTDAANGGEATRQDESVQAVAAPAEPATAPSEEARAAHASATSLFPLRESRSTAEASDADGRTPGPWPVVPDSKARTLTFEELIRDIALDEQRMNL